jgi:hypothetical protein
MEERLETESAIVGSEIVNWKSDFVLNSGFMRIVLGEIDSFWNVALFTKYIIQSTNIAI